jgi:hypothetical protein
MSKLRQKSGGLPEYFYLACDKNKIIEVKMERAIWIYLQQLARYSVVSAYHMRTPSF